MCRCPCCIARRTLGDDEILQSAEAPAEPAPKGEGSPSEEELRLAARSFPPGAWY